MVVPNLKRRPASEAEAQVLATEESMSPVHMANQDRERSSPDGHQCRRGNAEPRKSEALRRRRTSCTLPCTSVTTYTHNSDRHKSRCLCGLLAAQFAQPRCHCRLLTGQFAQIHVEPCQHACSILDGTEIPALLFYCLLYTSPSPRDRG